MAQRHASSKTKDWKWKKKQIQLKQKVFHLLRYIAGSWGRLNWWGFFCCCGVWWLVGICRHKRKINSCCVLVCVCSNDTAKCIQLFPERVSTAYNSKFVFPSVFFFHFISLSVAVRNNYFIRNKFSISWYGSSANFTSWSTLIESL